MSANARRVIVRAPDHPNATAQGTLSRARLIMSTHLGRPLELGELVHHINGDPTDDRVANLQVVTHGEHR